MTEPKLSDVVAYPRSQTCAKCKSGLSLDNWCPTCASARVSKVTAAVFFACPVSSAVMAVLLPDDLRFIPGVFAAGAPLWALVFNFLAERSIESRTRATGAWATVEGHD